MNIILDELELTDDERKKTIGDYFNGYIKVSSNGNVFEYKETCP